MNLKSSIDRLRNNLLTKQAEQGKQSETVPGSAQGESAPDAASVKITPSCYQFEHFPEYKEYTTMTWYYEKQKFPQNLFQPHVGGSDATVMIHGREFINYSTYNYLSLGFDDRVKQAAIKAIEDFGVGTGSGRSITGEIDLHQTFEEEICDVLGTEDAVLSVGGYSTNAFTIGYLCRSQDLILYDELIHNSALVGCKITGARRIAFPHNNYEALEELLRTHRPNFERVFILVEGVYSMDGDIPDIPRFIEIKKKYHALLMVDEAHSLGVIGKRGMGVTDYFNILGSDIDILFGSLSKSFGTCGGFVAGPKPLVAMLKYYAPGVLLYGASPTPANAAAALEALRVMLAEPERSQRLQRNAAYFIEKASAAGLDTYHSRDSAVVPVMMRDSELALWMSVRLFEDGICTSDDVPHCSSQQVPLMPSSSTPIIRVIRSIILH
ncbi:MAG: aminotransferase class I/II-fold pyridoxal phosphate-dependent enzyme [Pirellulaceae bacterium]